MRNHRHSISITGSFIQELPLSLSSRFSSSRREFLEQATLAGIAAAVLPARAAFAEKPASSIANALHPGTAVKNRAPLHASAFYFLPAGSIRPRGWLLDQLRTQADGLSGHLDETWADVGPDSGWLGGSGESWERGPYYVDGLVPLAWLLDDSRLKAKAQAYIDWTLTHSASNGMFGPSSNNDWWPRIVMLKALTQYQEFTADERVVPFMDRYFRHQLAALPARPLRDWGRFRWQDEALSVLWLYNRTGSPYLLDLVRLLHAQGFDWTAEFAHFSYTHRVTAEELKLGENDENGLKDLALVTHGVNNSQAIKTGPVWSLVSGNAADRNAAAHMIAELNRYHGLPNGMFSCDEHLAGLDPSQGSELCTVVEYMFSLEHALAITGDPAFGDRLEQLAFNALPGTFSDDMWAHQYNQEPNQVECSLHRKPWTTDGPESNLYGLEPNFGCCAANFHQGWPKFAASLFFLSGDQSSTTNDGLAAAAYAPCELRTQLRDTPVRITEETGYPFRGEIRFRIDPAAPLRFPFSLRIPAWAAGAALSVNGQPQPAPEPGSFARIDRTWNPGDRVVLTLPMTPRLTRGFHRSVSIERGPVLFSYGIAESWVKLRDRGMTADWQVFPAGAWNYALKVDENTLPQDITVAESEVGTAPFTREHAPVRLGVSARKLDNWRAVDGVADPVPESPVASTQPEESITLIPYAAAKLRITSFPQLEPSRK